jgi:flagellar biosynthetic protein FlhB
MADNDVEQHERTEQPTSKRLDDARRRGQVARSRELGMALVTIAGSMALLMGRSYYGHGFQQLMTSGLELPRSVLLDPNAMSKALSAAVALGLQLLAPLWMAVAGAAVVGATALGGWAFSAEALTPKFERLNPAAGFKRIFGATGLVELAKALAKFALVAVAAGFVLWSLAGDFMNLGTLTLQAALERAAWLSLASLAGFSATLALIAAADVPYQWWHHRKQLRMTKQEAREEQKESEGRPEVRSRIRQLQRAFARARMMTDVPKADVVAVNPTHYAVALRYDANNMKAPRVVAKGADLIAYKIRRVAEAHNVPIFEHPEFTRAVYHTSEIGSEISPRLYVAVAQVLTYIYQLRGRRVPGGQAPAARKARPEKPTLTIDPELLEPSTGRRGRRDGVRA